MNFFSHLECSVPCGSGPFDPRREQHLCTCGAPLLARYDLEAARAWSRESLSGRVSNMVRYAELMPLFDGDCNLAVCDHTWPFVAAFQKNNICGAQFHPEKSQAAGLRLISNFLELR